MLLTRFMRDFLYFLTLKLKALWYFETSVTTPFQTRCHIAVGHHERSGQNFLQCQVSPSGPWPHHFWGSAITLRHIKIGRIPLEEWSAGLRDHYLTTHNTHKSEISTFPGGIRAQNPEKRAASDPRLIPPRLWNQHLDRTAKLKHQHYFITLSRGQRQTGQLI
jgi:hypothetical protein